jgi:hypothetical protein
MCENCRKWLRERIKEELDEIEFDIRYSPKMENIASGITAIEPTCSKVDLWERIKRRN